MDLILGVDGGNTKTIALIANPDGEILGVGRAGCSDIYGAPTPQAALDELCSAVDAALSQANAARSDIAAGAFSMAGADWEEDYAFLKTNILERGLTRQAVIYNDALGSLRAGSPDGTGVVIAAGTGIATAAQNAAGEFWHTSFWQEGLGGYELGNRAIRAVVRAELGMTPPTTLKARILDYFGQPNVEGVIRLFTTNGKPAPSGVVVSKLAPIVLDEAENGDPTARDIVIEQANWMADYALASARKVGIADQPFTVVLNGGIFRHSGRLLFDTIRERIERTTSGVTFVHSKYEPAIGALMLGFDLAKIPITPARLANIELTMPDKSVYQT